MLNLSIILQDSARRYPAKAAFTFLETTFTYRQVNQAANQVANGLVSKGIGPGDKVALSCPNVLAFPILYYGIIKTGAVVVPLSILLKTEEIIYHLRDSDSKAYCCYTGTPELPIGQMGYEAFQSVAACEYFFMIMPDIAMRSSIEETLTLAGLMDGQPDEFEMYQTKAEDSCVIIYTSGTTGRPKGAELTHSNLLLNAILLCDLMNSHSEDVGLIVLPLFHIFGMTALLNAGVYKGGTGILMTRFDAAGAFALLQKHAIT